MRNFFFVVAWVSASALAAVPAWAFREPATIKSPSGIGAGSIVGLVLALLIVGISMMTPRRTHQD